MRKSVINKSVYVMIIVAAFLAGGLITGLVMSSQTNVETSLESDSNYQSLLGEIESIEEVERWTIRRDRYTTDSYSNNEWHLNIYLNDEYDTGFSFSERENTNQLMKDLQNVRQYILENRPNSVE